MNDKDFNIAITICYKCYSKCNSNTTEKTVICSNFSQNISLPNGYFLNVIKVTDDYISVIIQNGIYTYIRNVYNLYTTHIFLPSNCICQSLSISWKSI